jgi:hypothetical protein
MFRKKRNRILLYIALALSLPPVFVALYVFLPEVYIELVGFFLPDEQYRIPVRIGRKEYKLPLFFRSRAHKDRGDGVFPALILCGLPVEKPVEHLKIFPDRLGVFPTCDLFYRGHFALLLREGAYTTYELEDDMKGWDVEYQIERRNGMVRFLILPYRKSPAVPERLQRNNEPVSFEIPEKLLKRVPCFDKGSSWEKLPALQIIKPYRLLKSGTS